MKLHNLFTIAIGIFLLALAACSDSGDSTPTGSNPPPGGGNGTVSFSSDIQPILQARCAIPNCHGSGAIQSGLNMGGAAYSTITSITGNSGTKFVTANDANASAFYLKVKNPPAFGARMPNGGPYLTDAQIQNIQSWIDDGAQDN
jgi:hypothetical protein